MLFTFSVSLVAGALEIYNDVLNFTHCDTSRHHWKSDLNIYRVEAAWKLGRWDLLEDYLSSGKKKFLKQQHPDLICVTNICFPL